MALPNLKLIEAMRKTARKLQKGASYEWGHMGKCNCGNLAQEITSMTEHEIHNHAMMTRQGDWSEQTAEYCVNGHLPMDVMISSLLDTGLRLEDLKHLENLSDPEILRKMPFEKRYLQQNVREDLILYLETWANLLEESLLNQIALPDLSETEKNAVEIAL